MRALHVDLDPSLDGALLRDEEVQCRCLHVLVCEAIDADVVEIRPE